jgi:opacity protein-like surface antigen
MKPICRALIALCLTLLCSGPARAQQHLGPYVGAYLGGNLPTDAKATDDLGSFNLSYGPAGQWDLVLGWDLGPDNPLGGEGRVELEYARRSNPLDQAEFVEGKAKGHGELTVDSLLLNFIGALHNGSRWSPNVVIGIGAARMDAAGLKVSGQPLSNDTATVLAYQLGAGVDYALSDALSFDLGYRFFGTTPPKFTETNGHKFDTRYLSQSVVLGLRLGF